MSLLQRLSGAITMGTSQKHGMCTLMSVARDSSCGTRCSLDIMILAGLLCHASSPLSSAIPARNNTNDMIPDPFKDFLSHGHAGISSQGVPFTKQWHKCIHALSHPKDTRGAFCGAFTNPCRHQFSQSSIAHHLLFIWASRHQGGHHECNRLCTLICRGG